MSGTLHFPLGEQIADTVRVHGLAWAAAYSAKRRVPMVEFILLARGAGVL